MDRKRRVLAPNPTATVDTVPPFAANLRVERMKRPWRKCLLDINTTCRESRPHCLLMASMPMAFWKALFRFSPVVAVVRVNVRFPRKFWRGTYRVVFLPTKMIPKASVRFCMRDLAALSELRISARRFFNGNRGRSQTTTIRRHAGLTRTGPFEPPGFNLAGAGPDTTTPATATVNHLNTFLSLAGIMFFSRQETKSDFFVLTARIPVFLLWVIEIHGAESPSRI